MATGRDLQTIRKAAGLNAEVVAGALGTNRYDLSRFEQGLTDLPRAEVVLYVNAVQKCRAEAGRTVKRLAEQAKAREAVAQ